MKPVAPSRINFRPILFAAFGLAFGIFLFCKITFGSLSFFDFLFCAFFLCFLIRRPVRLFPVAAAFLAFSLFAAIGFGLIYANAERFRSGIPSGEYTLSGTVVSAVEGNGYSSLIVSGLRSEGKTVGGKLRLRVESEKIRVGDLLEFTGKITHAELTEQAFASDIRYTANVSDCEITGRTGNPFLLLNARLCELFYENMQSDEADIAYALTTGNGRALDGDFSEAVRKGGIAHIFAVSGLHIGIVYGAVYFLLKPLKKWRFLPATAVAFCYSALCAFTVSSLRAGIMCATAGGLRAFGVKRDFLESIAFAAIIVLCIFPAQWLSVGFQLSFGACLGLALFSGSLSRAFRKMPNALASYLAANLSVQIVTFPVLIEAFGYWSVWGTLVNFFAIPLLPVLFLGLLLCALFSLMIPPAAAFFLLFPEGMLSLLLFVFSVADFSFVLTGFSLGIVAFIWPIGCVALSERFRMKRTGRAVAAVLFSVVITVCILAENAVFYGCKINVYRDEDGGCAALVRTDDNAVLLIDDEISLSSCREFLSHTYGGTITAIAVLGEEEGKAINVAAFLGAEEVRACDETETGLRYTQVIFGECFSCGEVSFRYEGRSRIILFAEESAVEFSFHEQAAFGADLFVNEGCGGLIFFLHGGIIEKV